LNILFLTLAYPQAGSRNIYTDLLDEFVALGHQVFVICQNERRNKERTALKDENMKTVLRVRSLNITGDVSNIEKGVATITIDSIFIQAANHYLSNLKFDLILYSTPPITLCRCVSYFKERDNARTYLLLKDIFPQNAVDLGMMRSGGVLHRYFRSREKHLYAISDRIGCMSQANVDYVVSHNPQVPAEKVHILPNSVAQSNIVKTADTRIMVRQKYSIPRQAITFMYGGNMGKPQDVPYIVKCLRAVSDREDCFFIMCGSGSYYCVLDQYVRKEKPNNVLLINGLPKREYDALLYACDVGLLFLDHRFTIPNFPSRMLSYMENSMPILACTDPNTDVGKVIVDGGFGWWCESNNEAKFCSLVDEICRSADVSDRGQKAREYLIEHYLARHGCENILKILES